MAKAHSKQVADEYQRLAWSLRHEFRGPGDGEAYEYFFEWLREGEPVSVDWSKFRDRHTGAEQTGSSEPRDDIPLPSAAPEALGR